MEQCDHEWNRKAYVLNGALIIGKDEYCTKCRAEKPEEPRHMCKWTYMNDRPVRYWQCLVCGDRYND